ncbi:hypothetical protein ACMX2H_17960 [Arthrobacter sulfonylureivorans]|uniref:hypothetical protein n=1 Tax=Arthrobacter sulfonylureivorans TaxID=2486855 RepID=UPI0039E5D1EB
MDLLTSTITGLLFGAAIIYSVLRIIAGRAGNDAATLAASGSVVDSGPSDVAGRDAARMHAFWTAIIAFFASGLSAASKVGDVPAAYYAGDAAAPSWLADLLTVLVPLVSLAGIYVIGQYTWPRPRGNVRHADITIRRFRDYIPRALLVVMTAAAVLAVAVTVAVWELPGIEGFSGTQTFDGVEVTGEHIGRQPGSYLASILLIAILTLAAGVATATVVIVRRRPLASLNSEDNRILRIVLINRLFRTATLLFASLGGMAVSFANQQAPALILDGPAPATGWEPAQQLAGGLTVTLMIAMALWRPPMLAPDGAPGRPIIYRGSYAAGQEITESMHTVAVVFTVVALLAVGGWASFVVPPTTVADSGNPVFPAVSVLLLPLAFVVPVAVFVAVIASGEVRLWRGHTRSSAQPASDWPAYGRTTPAARLVPRPLLAAAAGGAVLLGVAIGFNAAAPGRQPDLLAAFAAAGIGLLLFGAAAVQLVHRRPRLFEATPEADNMLRRASAFRVARMTAAGLFALTAQLLLAHPAAWGWFLDGRISLYVHQLSPDLHTALRITTAVLYLAAVVLALLPSASRPRRSVASHIGHPVAHRSGYPVPYHSDNPVPQHSGGSTSYHSGRPVPYRSSPELESGPPGPGQNHNLPARGRDHEQPSDRQDRTP